MNENRVLRVLLAGDSVIDNKCYVEPGEPDVTAQLKALLGEPHQVEKVARDGACVLRELAGVPSAYGQLADVNPAEHTHLVISVGGNDALGHLQLLFGDSLELDELVRARAQFVSDYETMLQRALRLGLPIAISTIYYLAPGRVQELLGGAVEPGKLEARAVTLVGLFNDIILSLATQYRLPVLDLRYISTTPECYANPIEPSAHGGQRIAETIATIIREHNFTGPAAIYAHPDASRTLQTGRQA